MSRENERGVRGVDKYLSFMCWRGIHICHLNLNEMTTAIDLA